MKRKILGLIFMSLMIITIFAVAVAVSAQVWVNPAGKVNFGHSHNWTTLLNFPIDCPAGQFVSGVDAVLTCATPITGADNDWLFSANNIYRTSGTVAIGSFPGTVQSLSKLYVRNGPGNNAAQRIEHSGTNVMGLFINPISGGNGPSLWANGRGRFDALVVGSVAGDNVAFNPGSGNLIVANYTQLALTNSTPPSTDCDSASELGRMKVENSGGGFLYVCTITTSGIGWVAK